MSKNNRVSWRTYILVGGALLSCGFGALALRCRRRLPRRTEVITASEQEAAMLNANTLAEKWRQDAERREAIKQRNDKIRARSKWMQTFEEITLEIPVAADVRSEDIDCQFRTKFLSVVVKSSDIFKGTLSQKIVPDACTWELEDAGAFGILTISLIKGEFNMGDWKKFLEEDD